MNQELLLLLRAVWMGLVLMLCYDGLRIFRGVFPHDHIGIAIEDLSYWILSALYIFVQMYEENHGMIRIFVFAGILLGMLGYHKTLSPFLVPFFVTLLRIPVKYLYSGIKRLKFKSKRCKILIHERWKAHRLKGYERIRGKKIEESEKQAKKVDHTESSGHD